MSDSRSPTNSGEFVLGGFPELASRDILRRLFDPSPLALGMFLRWLNDKVVAFVDPGKEERRDALATALYQSLARDKSQFELDRAQLALGIDSDDADHVIERVYRRVLATGWKDGQLGDAEKRTLHWVAQKLQIATETAREINLDYAKRAFEKALSKAMEDGYVDEDEAAALERVAAGMGSTVAALVAHCFASEGDSLLRGIFLAAAEDGAITALEWSRLVQTAQRLGLSPQKLSATLAPHVEPFIEHVLADVKADGELTEAEDRTLSWLLEQIPVPARTERYVRQELAELRQIQAARLGRLPSLANPTWIELRSGEIVHFTGGAVYYHERRLQNGPRIDEYEGTVTITDARLLFSSPLRSFTINHRSVLSLVRHPNSIEVRASTKGAGRYAFGERTRLAHAIYLTSVGRANQTIVEATDGLPSRHIPRDVRQRVWQRYGGRCAECQDTQYLEFDHIVPVARGGSNSDQNVQLLCRRCNGKKGDRI